MEGNERKDTKMKPKVNKTFVMDMLETLLLTPSPSGYCHTIMDRIRQTVWELGFSFELTNKGCGLISIEGENSGYSIGMTVHVDTLGAMVRSVKESGRLRF